MLFNSYAYILIFLPVIFAVYFLLNRSGSLRAGNAWLFLSSLFFYSFWNVKYLPLLCLSIAVNYFFGKLITKTKLSAILRKCALAGGLVFNLGLLCYFKYADFLITNVNLLFDANHSMLYLMLPLAISFFTFQQISFLVDTYKGITPAYSFLDYCLFVSFFPQLIAGPIVHHREMMPQFRDPNKKMADFRNIAPGLTIFFIGLFKKAVIADTFSGPAITGFDQLASLSFIEAWTASLCYTFQIYYDFSGYTDMAIGSALLFNIRLPDNFNSPYKAMNIQEFWRRWHMTLSRWLRDHVYIPLGGSRSGETRSIINIFITFLLGGIWHGAGWTFILWGAMHGSAYFINSVWKKSGMRLAKFPAWLCTFLFINFSWVFFRAASFSDALKVLKGMLGLNGFVLPIRLRTLLAAFESFGIEFGKLRIYHLNEILIMIGVFGTAAVILQNTIAIRKNFKPDWRWQVYSGIVAATGILFINRVSEFLYFQF